MHSVQTGLLRFSENCREMFQQHCEAKGLIWIFMEYLDPSLMHGKFFCVSWNNFRLSRDSFALSFINYPALSSFVMKYKPYFSVYSSADSSFFLLDIWNPENLGGLLRNSPKRSCLIVCVFCVLFSAFV